MTRASYRSVDSTRWLTVGQISKEIDRTPAQTQKLLDKAMFLGLHGRIGQPRRYPASAVEVLKAMLEVPHRPVPQAGQTDWLSRYEGEQQ